MTKGLEFFKTQFYRLKNNDTALFCGVTAVCLYYYLVFQPVILDDAFIYFRIVNNLIETGRPVFNIGDSFFVATSPLWTLFLFVSKIVFPILSLELIAKIWWAILLTLASAFAYSAFSPLMGKGAVFIACPFFLSPLISSMTGNEIALLYFAMFGLIWACTAQKPIVSGIFLGMGYLARGEFVLAAIPLLLCFVLNGKKRGVEPKQIIFNLVAVSAVALVVVLPWHGYYFLTFHGLFPRTFLVKMIQGQSGQWLLFHQAIGYYLFQLLGGRIYLLALGFVGAWRQPVIFRFMALYTFFHTVMYAVLKIPYYHWYYYDYYIFVLILILFGIFSLIDMGNAFLARFIESAEASGGRLLQVYRLFSAIVFVCVFFLLLPVQLELFRSGHFSDIYRNNKTDARYNSYMDVGNTLLKEIGPADIVLSGEVGILSYVLQNYEVRDINGLASPNVTTSNMNDWNYFVDYYKPRYIVYRGSDQEEIKAYQYNDSVYQYRRYYFIPETTTHVLAGVYIRLDSQGE